MYVLFFGGGEGRFGGEGGGGGGGGLGERELWLRRSFDAGLATPASHTPQPHTAAATGHMDSFVLAIIPYKSIQVHLPLSLNPPSLPRLPFAPTTTWPASARSAISMSPPPRRTTSSARLPLPMPRHSSSVGPRATCVWPTCRPWAGSGLRVLRAFWAS